MKNSFSKLLAACTIFGLSLAATDSQAQSYHQYGHNNCADTLGQYIFTLDQYGDQMSYFYSMEARGYCGCTNAAALLSEMRRYNVYTNNLLAAYQGTCPVTFKRAACSVRDSLTRIEHLRNRARVGHQVCGLISQSCPLATYVHNNAHQFRPVVAPVYPHHSSHSHHRSHRHDRGPRIDVGSAILGAVAGRVIHGVIHNH
ncbi:MAG: hypothetical protein P1V20_14425 [Verrucomicrobiales bacterium]|nr:hypothetical protein [Verrucomicrobiales bacterium]